MLVWAVREMYKIGSCENNIVGPECELRGFLSVFCMVFNQQGDTYDYKHSVLLSLQLAITCHQSSVVCFVGIIDISC